MPDYFYAVGSALLWAVSAPVVNIGLARLPDSQRMSWITIGLFLALLTGTVALVPSLYLVQQPFSVNGYLLLSGLFTFPLATLAYYLSGQAFAGRTEFASQFSKIKPLLTFALALLVLRETVSQTSLVSVALIAIGTVIFLFGAHRHAISARGVGLGLLAALFWALGEIFMKLGLDTNHPVHANLAAISGGLAALLIIAIFALRNIRQDRNKVVTLWPFMLHGIISFAIAYSLFFYSIDKIGLAHTVLINAFWPILSIIITAAVRQTRRQAIDIPAVLIIGSLVLLAGSLVQVFAFM